MLWFQFLFLLVGMLHEVKATAMKKTKTKNNNNPVFCGRTSQVGRTVVSGGINDLKKQETKKIKKSDVFEKKKKKQETKKIKKSDVFEKKKKSERENILTYFNNFQPNLKILVKKTADFTIFWQIEKSKNISQNRKKS